MKSLANRNTNIIFYLAFILFILLIFVLTSGKIYGMCLYPDEFGYWSSAATALGYDWAKITSLGSYYSYGYSLILIPILYFTKGGILAYRIAIFVNFVLIILSIFFITNIVGRLYPKIQESSKMFVTMVTVLYPSWMFYAQTTMSECLLYFLYVVLSWIMARILLEEANLGWYISLGLMLGYLPMVHMRTIGVVIACFIVLLISSIRRRKITWKEIVSVLFFVTLFIIGYFLKKYVQQVVYAYSDTNTLAINDYDGQSNKLISLFSFEGFVSLIQSVLGKVLYLITSTYGLISVVVFGLLDRFREKKQDTLYFLYILLSMLGMLGITSIYILESWSVDAIVYGRYEEIVAPMLIAIGAGELINKTNEKRINLIIANGLLLIIGLTVTIFVISNNKLEGIRGYHTVAMSYFMNMETSDSIKVLMSVITGFVIMVIILVFSKKTWIFGVVAISEVICASIASTNYVYRGNGAISDEIKFLNVITRSHEEGYPENITYVFRQGKDPAGGFLQFYFKDKIIDTYILETDESINIEDIKNLKSNLIYTDRDTDVSEIMGEVLPTQFYKVKTVGDYEVFYK